MTEVIEKEETRSKQSSFGKFGLSSLFGDSNTDIETYDNSPASNLADGSEFLSIPTSRITTGNFQPRTEFDQTALKELADSIAKNGIIQPIVVRRKSGGEFEIIAGERRWRAAKMLNLENIPVLVKQLEDKEVFELAIIENVQREDLNPLEEAYAYRRLLGEFGYTQDDLARTVGKSRSHIANLLRLLSLPEEIKTFVREGKISMGHARALLVSKNPEELAQRIISEGLTVRQVEEINSDSLSDIAVHVPENTSEAAKTKPAKTGDVIALEEMLSNSLSAKVSIKAKGKRGEIKIKYKNLEELDNLLAKLGAS